MADLRARLIQLIELLPADKIAELEAAALSMLADDAVAPSDEPEDGQE